MKNIVAKLICRERTKLIHENIVDDSPVFYETNSLSTLIQLMQNCYQKPNTNFIYYYIKVTCSLDGFCDSNSD